MANIASSIGGHWKEKAESLLGDGRSRLESELDEWEKKLNRNKEEKFHNSSKFNKKPTQLEEDLQVFGLKEGAAWKSIKKAYRRESKKYHSDFHINDPEKKKIAHEIMLIYNAAYERLEKYYGEK
ncbi:MAG: hypothetical protein OEV42_07585 [Deltaproteobacteria bacterium]|nr:hypothetical protein [Deltaproteobacteria bacterium]